mmetsp:Transcript_8136/g.21536  ORF Transcript_8136/g.21536 Transcript_8136/m.21536 type:complete len:238 (-) Transcript_8136:612-1325(-)
MMSIAAIRWWPSSVATTEEESTSHRSITPVVLPAASSPYSPLYSSSKSSSAPVFFLRGVLRGERREGGGGGLSSPFLFASCLRGEVERPRAAAVYTGKLGRTGRAMPRSCVREMRAGFSSAISYLRTIDLYGLSGCASCLTGSQHKLRVTSEVSIVPPLPIPAWSLSVFESQNLTVRSADEVAKQWRSLPISPISVTANTSFRCPLSVCVTLPDPASNTLTDDCPLPHTRFLSADAM